MHAALSVLVFTVTAGFGLGLLFWSSLVVTFGHNSAYQTSLIVGIILTTIGLLASTFHLANPKNAWRAFSRFRTSWLSREGILSVLLYPLALLTFWVSFSETPGILLNILALLVAIFSVSIIFTTSMIYACLKTIRQWNNALVPLNFLLMAFSSGGILWCLILSFSDETNNLMNWIIITQVLLVMTLLSKGLYYFWIGKPKGPTINTAIGMTQASVKLLDTGHSGDTFLTREFGRKVPTEQIRLYRIASLSLAFIVPFALLLAANSFTLFIACASAYTGLLIERWLFFVEARHVVNLFHGDQHT